MATALFTDSADGPGGNASPADAFAHALGYLLGLPAPAMPVDGSGWLLDWGRDWCASRGVGLIVMPMAMPLPVLLVSMHTLNPGQAFLLAGSSQTLPRTDHSVACESGRIVRDLGGKGIGGPGADGNFWAAFIGARRPGSLN